uniref:RelA/SpoT domain-containing protein n=1 Tax=Haptolina brevifila TaxID=156173 RepID=A0A7S2GN10_9EUKA
MAPIDIRQPPLQRVKSEMLAGRPRPPPLLRVQSESAIAPSSPITPTTPFQRAMNSVPRVSFSIAVNDDSEAYGSRDNAFEINSPLLVSRSTRRLNVVVTRHAEQPVRHTISVDLGLMLFLFLCFASVATGLVVSSRPIIATTAFAAQQHGGRIPVAARSDGSSVALAALGGTSTDGALRTDMLAAYSTATLRSRAGLVRFCLGVETRLEEMLSDAGAGVMAAAPPRWLVARASEALCALAFPVRFSEIARVRKLRRPQAERTLESAAVELKMALRSALPAGSTFTVQVRYKSAVSLFEKMMLRGKAANDLLALRVVLERDGPEEQRLGGCVDRCYDIARVVSGLWSSSLSDPKDYIAHPKPNGYQSLHHLVLTRRGAPLEVQIRTRCMHEVAEGGAASHGAYKRAAAAAVV